MLNALGSSILEEATASIEDRTLLVLQTKMIKQLVRWEAGFKAGNAEVLTEPKETASLSLGLMG